MVALNYDVDYTAECQSLADDDYPLSPTSKGLPSLRIVHKRLHSTETVVESMTRGGWLELMMQDSARRDTKTISRGWHACFAGYLAPSAVRKGCIEEARLERSR